jgi:uncharacterized protein DUF551
MDWISVKDKLPEEYKNVLIFRPKPVSELEVGWAVFKYQGGSVEWMSWSGEDSFSDVTHWMMLPDPPKWIWMLVLTSSTGSGIITTEDEQEAIRWWGSLSMVCNDLKITVDD